MYPLKSFPAEIIMQPISEDAAIVLRGAEPYPHLGHHSAWRSTLVHAPISLLFVFPPAFYWE